ncbi:RNA-directed DNA polymerase [Pseudomonas frederiksbergensis]|uniref:RNA-directed DNA polymerase n=1 Tax=Pseudomonas frederiksbergensis TaxID=104087 RepID=A0A2S8H4Q3_9PSED|nr:reverse transcriptase family protein [Pseudomonas frederiksbergensis]PQO96749.1 RNA-directed DNA polymerase [Pseudomonas frederiksbergensis]
MTDWKPQPYRRAAEELGVSEAVLEAAIAASEAVVAVHTSLPPILTLGHLSHLSGVSYHDLRSFVSRDEPDPYKVFRVRKRPQPDGRLRFRVICVPDARLGDAQRWIARQVLVHGRPHSASTAFAPKARLIDAVRPHCGSRWLIKIDVRRFFESISEISVYKVFRGLGYQPLVSLELARLCTRVGPNTWLTRTQRWWRRAPLHASTIRNYALPRLGHLPQGAPTSPMLANLVMREADIELSKIAKSYGLTFTRYADDLTFSTTKPKFDRAAAGSLIQQVYQVLGRFGLEPNLAKTQVVPPRARKIVLGLLADRDAPCLTREFKNKMRMHLHYLEHEDIGPVRHAQHRGFSAVAGLRNHLLGLAAYASQIEPVYGAEIKTRLMAVPWPIIY